MRILWLDNTPEMVRFPQECCRYDHRDWTFTTTPDPVWAIRMLETQPYDLVITDVKLDNPLPEGMGRVDLATDDRIKRMAGIHLWREYRHPAMRPTKPTTPKTVPIIVCTAVSDDTGDMLIGKYIGPYDIIHKPIQTEDLQAVIEAVEAGKQPVRKRWYDIDGIDGGWSSSQFRPNRDTPPPIRWAAPEKHGPTELEW